jgi:archaemetzincin
MRRLVILGATLSLTGLYVGAWLIVSKAALLQNASSERPSPRALTDAERQALPRSFQTLVPLHRPLDAPAPGDWLDRHQEAGQNYREYLAARPVHVTGRRRTIYVQPLGEFTDAERRIVQLAAEFLGHAFQLPVKIRDDLPSSVVPAAARREHGNPQILSTYVLDRVLKPRLPDDAVTYIALTATDLWPGEGWNFVFGQASLADRVGVWSIHRFGDPGESDEAFRTALVRTLKTSVHETGHMFSLAHCVHFECVMCGSNHLKESDSRPLAFCPQCLAKIAYATGADPRKRLAACAQFAEKNGLTDEAAFWRRSIEAMEAGGR